MRSVFLFLFCMSLGFSALAENLYETLGVPNTATREEIKKAWKSLVKANHPDRFMGEPDKAKEANDKLAIINAAETVLGNEILRGYYDHFSYKGTNHNRWASIPGNSNESTMVKRYGPVENLDKPKDIFGINSQKEKAAQPKPQAHGQSNSNSSTDQSKSQYQSYGSSKTQQQAKQEKKDEKTQKQSSASANNENKSSQSNKSESTTEPNNSNEATESLKIFETLKNNSLSELEWRAAYTQYRLSPKKETSAEIQMALLDILREPLADWKFDFIAQAYVLKTDLTKDDTMSKILQKMSFSANPIDRKIAVSVTYYSVVKNLTQELLKMTKAEAEALLIDSTYNKDPEVKKRADFAVEKLKIKYSPEHKAPLVIRSLSSEDRELRNRAFQSLVNIKDLNESDLNNLTQELINRNAIYKKAPLPQLMTEMTAISEVLERVHSPIIRCEMVF